MAMSKAMLKWRSKESPGAIMKPETFQKIKRSATKRYGSAARGENAAGAAYWGTAKAKYKESKK